MVREGYKETNCGILPEDWNIVTINEIAVDMADGPFGSNLKKIHYTNKQEARIIQLSNIGEDGWKDVNTKYTTFEHAKTISRCIVAPGNAVVAKMMPAGRTIICPNEDPMYVLSSDAVKIVFNEEEVLTKFFVYATKTKLFQNQIGDEIQGSTRARTSVSKLRKNHIALPPLSEQTAITAALSDIDELIISIEELIEKKKAIKQGVMQALLTGRKRLTGYEDEWRNISFSEVLKLQGGYAFKSGKFVKYGVPIIRISNLIGGKIDLSDVAYYEEFNILNQFLVKKGDILIAMSGATTGKTAVYDIEGSSYLNQRVGKFVVIDENTLYYKYLKYILESNQFFVKLSDILTAGAQPNISSKDIEKMDFYIPATISEQKSIVQVLSNMDLEIEQLQEKQAKYRQIKQGMISELLTGKIRLI